MGASLRLIKTVPKEKPDYVGLHLGAMTRSYLRFLQSKERTDLLKTVNHGVRAVMVLDRKTCPANDLFMLCESVAEALKQITPRELMQVFPPEKTYDGDKWQAKDYYSTMETVKAHGPDRAIGDGDANRFLWGYMNLDLMEFEVARMCSMSDLYRQQTGEGIMEKYFKEQGVKTYTMHTDSSTGKQYIHDEETGEYSEVKRPRPCYLKIVNGGEK